MSFDMNEILRKPQLTPYEADYAQWCVEQGALLRAGRLDALDRENLAEEIESLGRSEKYEIEPRLNVLIMHLLKYRYQPDGRSSGWRGTIKEQRNRLKRRLKDSPSLKTYPAEILNEEYELARLKAAGETGLPEGTFPGSCPFTIEEILDDSFLPEGL
jgi:hypothetical protein